MASQQEVLLQDLQPCLSKPKWQNFLLLVGALQVARSFILWRVAFALALPISHESRCQRLKRVLSWQESDWRDLRRAWVRAAIDLFAPGLGPLVVMTDWTKHTDRCQSLWVQLPVGGRGVPLAFWLTANSFGGAGKQREFEDAAFRELAEWLPPGRVIILLGDRGFGGRDRMRFFRYQVGWPHPKPVRDSQGHLTGKTVTETVWYLVTNLPLTVDVVALYALRMQVEESFRDYKTEFGLEGERTADPVQRLPLLLLALMGGWRWRSARARRWWAQTRRSGPGGVGSCRRPRLNPSSWGAGR